MEFSDFKNYSIKDILKAIYFSMSKEEFLECLDREVQLDILIEIETEKEILAEINTRRGAK